MNRMILPLVILGVFSFVWAGQPDLAARSSESNKIHAAAQTAKSKKGVRAEARLEGNQEVPPADTDADGEFRMQFDCAFTAAHFKLEVEADDVVQAHLHCGSAGENGPVIAFLFGMVPGGFDVDGELAEFTLTNANLDAVNADCMATIGSQIETLTDLADAIGDGNVYVNVHTVAFPGGEIRGQLSLSDKPSRCNNSNDNSDDDDDDDGGGHKNPGPGHGHE